jgi:hypothetical protein
MKKKLAVVVLIICAVAATWVYQAYKFERDVKIVYLPTLNQYKENIAYDTVIIDKFKFKVTLKNLKIHSKNHELSFVSDRLVIKQNPLIKRTYLDSYGSIDKSGVPEDTLYAPDHHIAIMISEPFTGSNLDDLSINIKNNEFKLFDSKTDMQLLALEHYNLNLQHKISTKDNYTLEISSRSKNVRLSDLFTEFVSHEFLKLLPEFQFLASVAYKSSDDYYNFLSKFDEIVGGTNESSKVLLTYPKELFNKILTIDFTSAHALAKFVVDDILPENFDLNFEGDRTNKFVDGKFSLNFNNNERSKLEFSINHDYNSDLMHKPELIEFTADYLQKIVNRDLNKLFSDENGPLIFTQSDFIKILEPFKNISNVNLSGLFEHPRAEGAASHLLKARVNNFAFEFNGTGDSLEYNSEINIANFAKLVKSISDYGTQAIQPLVIKAKDQEVLAKLQRLINMVDQYGLDALSVLNNNTEQDTNNFLMKVKRGNSLKALQINGKDWGQILMDKRIQIFLQNLMPVEAHKENQDS